MDKFLEQLKITFASEFSFYLKAHYFHWNVEGPNFPQYHQLFGDIYQEVYGNIDTFAEQIRAATGYTPGSLHRFSMLSEIDDAEGVPAAEIMLMQLLADAIKMQTMHMTLFVLAEERGEYGLSNFLAERQDAFKKHAWMLRATTKPTYGSVIYDLENNSQDTGAL